VTLSLIEGIVVLGIGVVLPLALGGPILAWVAATAAAFAAFQVRTGPAAALVVPFGIVAATVFASRIPVAMKRRTLAAWRAAGIAAAAEIVAPGYAVVAAISLFASRAGLTLFGIGEPIVELTAVHYTYAGVAALVLAGAAASEAEASGRGRRLALVAVACTAAAPPLVATGFTTRAAVPQVGGAVLMTIGVWSTAVLQLRTALSRRRSAAAVLLASSGLSIWITMILAVAWAAGQHWNVPALSVEDMARTHGIVNAVGFCLAGLTARRLDAAAR
jgi:hypothetical protein